MSKRSFVLTVTLNPAIDMNLTVTDWRFDDTNRAVSVRKDSGGKGINVSRVVAEMGGATRALCFLGGHTGREFHDRLRAKGIELKCVRIENETRLNVVITNQTQQKQIKVNQQGPRINHAESRRFERLLGRELPHAAFVAFCGSLPPGLPRDTYQRLVERARRRNVRAVLDADGEVLRQGVVGKPFLLKPNRYELERLMGRNLTSQGAVIDAARQLLARGVEVVVVSDADRPCIAVRGQEVWIGIPPKVKVLSTVGSGDSLIAGLVMKFVEGKSLREALRFGIALGTAAATTPDTQLCLRKDIPPIYKRVRVEKG